MKNIIRSLVIFGVLFQSLAAYSQIGFTASLKGGVSLGKMHYEEEYPEEWEEVDLDRSFNLGPNIGATIGLSLTNLIELETGIGFIRKGEKEKGSFEIDTFPIVYYETSANLDYLTIPALIKIKPPIAFSVKPYGIAGLSIGIPLSAKVYQRVEFMGETTDTTIDVKDEVKMDLGLNVGAGVEFSMGNFLPFVEFIYDFGLVDIAKFEGEPEETKEATRTMLLSAGIKYNF
ncbi:PorT family protein [candidate division WOR-3 bacterium]|nr:PorT family protein [candidate division WOR-3 bacterium]